MPRAALDVVGIEKRVHGGKAAIGYVADGDRDQYAIQPVFEKQRVGPVADQETMIIGFAGIGHAAIIVAAVDVAPIKVEMFVSKTPLHDIDLDVRISSYHASLVA